jgi:uncharacterized protein YjdB
MKTRALLVLAATLSGCVGNDRSGAGIAEPSLDSMTVTMTPPAAMLRIGESVRFTALVLGGPPSVSRDVTFASSNDTTVVVFPLGNGMGKATALANGAAVVTATSVGNPLKAAASTITVAP